MEWYRPENAYNIVRDWNKLQGMTHPSDEHIQRRRDLDARLVSIENSSTRPVSVAITTYYHGPLPQPQFTLEGGEIKHVGINTFGGPMQFIHLLDPQTGEYVGHPAPFRTNSHSFVLRDGINAWFVQAFRTSGYHAH